MIEDSKITLNHKLLISFFVSLSGLLAFLLYLAQPPKFPENGPAYYPKKENFFNQSGQGAFFNNFTQFINKNHGGLLVYRELNRLASVNDSAGNVTALFQQQYKYFNRTLFLDLIKKFSEQKEIPFQIRENAIKDSMFPHRYELFFLRNNAVWVKIQIEAGKEVGAHKENTPEHMPVEVINPEKKQPPVEKKSNKPKLAIIISNFGNEFKMVHQFLNINAPITFAVMPQLPYSTKIAELIHQKGNELLLQQPMEPTRWPEINPGPGALFLNDSPDGLVYKLDTNLKSVPFAIGINNYMGSAFTKDRFSMNKMMQYLKEKELVFINSKTSSGNLAKNMALNSKVGFVSRDIFLDDIEEEKHIRVQLYKAIKVALKHGQAVVIGRQRPITLKTLQNNLSLIKENGVEIATISALF